MSVINQNFTDYAPNLVFDVRLAAGPSSVGIRAAVTDVTKLLADASISSCINPETEKLT